MFLDFVGAMWFAIRIPSPSGQKSSARSSCFGASSSLLVELRIERLPRVDCGEIEPLIGERPSIDWLMDWPPIGLAMLIGVWSALATGLAPSVKASEKGVSDARLSR
mmetsp:Transcript_27594/g.72876  ORF Transcript_27594/g.72876 Transcript_27594/m.72876 type:complete len:107 (-) Transcript_27594:275-595(-)